MMQTVHLLFNSTMFNKLTTDQFVSHGYSDCCEYIIANIKNGTAFVRYSDGSGYLYTNVSRRALTHLVFNTQVSLGRWVNHNLLGYDSRTKCECVYDYALS